MLALVEDVVKDTSDSQGPDDAKHDPALDPADRDQRIWGVRPSNGDVDGGVVKDLEDPAGSSKNQAVVKGGKKVEQDHAGAVNGEGGDS